MIASAVNGLLDLFFPRLCITCRRMLLRKENVMCLECISKIPRTNFHDDPENIVSKIFWGRVEIERATSFFYFRKSSRYQQVLHELKYRKNKDVGIMMGRYFGKELNESPFRDIDIIVPVPLHPKREKERGYNQSQLIAEGLGESMGKKTDFSCIIRSVNTVSQTKQKKTDRWDNVKDIFEVKNPVLAMGKHVLLVDDVITTGSTLEACASTLLEVPGCKVSVASLAIAVN